MEDVIKLMKLAELSDYFQKVVLENILEREDIKHKERLVFKQMFIDIINEDGVDIEVVTINFDSTVYPMFETNVMVHNKQASAHKIIRTTTDTKDNVQFALVLRALHLIVVQKFDFTVFSKAGINDAMETFGAMLDSLVGHSEQLHISSYDASNHYELVDRMELDDLVSDKNLRLLNDQNNLFLEKSVILINYTNLWATQGDAVVADMKLLVDQQYQSYLLLIGAGVGDDRSEINYFSYIEIEPMKYEVKMINFALRGNTSAIANSYQSIYEDSLRLIEQDKNFKEFGDDSSLLKRIKQLEDLNIDAYKRLLLFQKALSKH